MIKYIVYKTKTDFTKRYAALLSAKFKIPYLSMEEAKKKLISGESILYMAGIRASKLYDIKKALAKYNVEAVVAVGMSALTDEYNNEIKNSNNIKDIPLFYLRGGTAPDKLTGFDKFLFNAIAKMTEKSKQKADKTADLSKKEEIQLTESFFKGIDYVAVENLDSIIDWYSSYLIIQDMISKKHKK